MSGSLGEEEMLWEPSWQASVSTAFWSAKDNHYIVLYLHYMPTNNHSLPGIFFLSVKGTNKCAALPHIMASGENMLRDEQP